MLHNDNVPINTFELISPDDPRYQDLKQRFDVESDIFIDTFLSIQKKIYFRGKPIGQGFSGKLSELINSEEKKINESENKNTEPVLLLKEFKPCVKLEEIQTGYKITQLLYGNAAISEKNRMIVIPWIKGNPINYDFKLISSERVLERLINIFFVYLLFQKRHIAHMDIKIANMLIDENEYIYLIDFERSIYPATLQYLMLDASILGRFAEDVFCNYLSQKYIKYDKDNKEAINNFSRMTELSEEEKKEIPYLAQYIKICHEIQLSKNNTVLLYNTIIHFMNLYETHYPERVLAILPPPFLSQESKISNEVDNNTEEKKNSSKLKSRCFAESEFQFEMRELKDFLLKDEKTQNVDSAVMKRAGDIKKTFEKLKISEPENIIEIVRYLKACNFALNNPDSLPAVDTLAIYAKQAQAKPSLLWKGLGILMMGLGALLTVVGGMTVAASSGVTLTGVFSPLGLGIIPGIFMTLGGIGLFGSGYKLYRCGKPKGLSKEMLELSQEIRLRNKK